MSKETLESLNSNTLIGHTDYRGTAWHYRAELQGGEPNHYPGAIPVADVERRLFHWIAESRRLSVEVPADLMTLTHLSDDGTPMAWQHVDGRQAITRSDTDELLGIFADSYVRHQYREWLLTTVANILDDDLSISSAGLLKSGAIAWVEVSVPETITTPEGVEFRPNLLATTSFDGSIATTFKRTITATVCDNTRSFALAEQGQEYKVKHSRWSQLKLGQTRAALEIVHTTADAFAAEVAQLARTPVTDRQWAGFLDTLVPIVDTNGDSLQGRSLSLAEKKREGLERMYRHDDRAAPWAGTALGVMHAVNTFEHHESTVRGASRPERNMLRMVTGDFTKLDQTTWANLQKALATT